MHSSAILAANGSVSLRPICAEPNRTFISVVRNVPSACDTSSGIVIISIPASVCTPVWHRCYPNICGSDRDREVALCHGAAVAKLGQSKLWRSLPKPSLRGAKRRSNPESRARLDGLLRFARNDGGRTGRYAGAPDFTSL